jgi:predicted RNA-binding Zn ribbon-like protein
VSQQAASEARATVKTVGRMTPSGFLFELSGGALCLDFVNTVDNRPTPQPRELLNGYPDLVSWARQAGAVTAGQARALETEAAHRPREARTTLERARAVRETLFALFSAAAAGRRLPEAELESLNPPLASTLGRLRLAPGRGRGAHWIWPDEPALERMMWAVLRSAADLLTSDDLGRLRECAADTCAWLFLDRSKNGSRRWCDMTVCGNRDKVRRHRQRQRGRRG